MIVVRTVLLSEIDPTQVAEARRAGADIAPRIASPIDRLATFTTRGDMTGWIGVVRITADTAHIRGWYVRPPYRRQGYGKALLEYACDRAWQSRITTIEIRTAHEWVTAWGFTPTGEARAGGNQERPYLLRHPEVQEWQDRQGALL